MHDSGSTIQGIDRDALVRVVEPIAVAHGAELVDIEFRREQHGWVLRVFVEKEGASAQGLSTRDAAVDLDLCAGISRDLSPALDVADVIPHAYHLEVSSPGVERPLRGEGDFVRFAGHRAKLRLRDPIRDAAGAVGQRVVVGTLGAVAEGTVILLEGGRSRQIPLGSIESARLVFEFGSAKPQGRAKRPSGRDTQQRKH
jgi:ribosome maturation factor RimP